MDITSNPPKGKLNNYIKLDNPINNKDKNSHVRKYVGSSKKKNFSKWNLKYEISKKDLEKIENHLKNKKSRWANNKV